MFSYYQSIFSSQQATSNEIKIFQFSCAKINFVTLCRLLQHIYATNLNFGEVNVLDKLQVVLTVLLKLP